MSSIDVSTESVRKLMLPLISGLEDILLKANEIMSLIKFEKRLLFEFRKEFNDESLNLFLYNDKKNIATDFDFNSLVVVSDVANQKKCWDILLTNFGNEISEIEFVYVGNP